MSRRAASTWHRVSTSRCSAGQQRRRRRRPSPSPRALDAAVEVARKLMAEESGRSLFSRSQAGMQIHQMQVRVIFGLVALNAVFSHASAQTTADTVALSASIGVMIGTRYQVADGARLPTVRPGLMGRRADSAFTAALRSASPAYNTTRRGDANAARDANVTFRLTRLEWRGDSAVVGVESESCNPRIASGMNWWRSEQAYLLVRHPTEQWLVLWPLIGGSTQDGTCR